MLTCIREKITIDRAGRKLAANAERHPEAAGGDGAAVPRRAGGDRRDAAPERGAHLLARRTALRISRRDTWRASPTRRTRSRISPPRAPSSAIPHGIPAKVRASIEHELTLIAQLALRALFPHRARHRALRALAKNPLPGPRLGGQFRGLLLPRHHRGRSRPRRSAVRALHLAGAPRAARHRRRFRARAARGGDPVHLRQIRPRARRHRRDRDLLSRPLAPSARSARPSACPRTPSARSRPRSGAGGGGVRRPSSRAPASIRRQPRASSRSRRSSREIIGFPRHLSQHVGGFVITRSRLDEVMPIGNARDGGPHHRRMGQGRSRRARHSQDRRARARHADLPAQGARSCRQALRRARRPSPPSRPRTPPSTACSAAPTRSACSRSKAARR